MRGVVLGGFMGVGKSSVGAIVAARLAVPFVDTDAELVRRHGAIAEQFAHDGETVFRQRERAVVEALCDGRVRVVATGGGVWASALLVEQLGQHYERVVLSASLSTLRERLTADGSRPLWRDAEALYIRRQPDYAVADGVISTDGVTVAVVADRVEAWWRSR